MAANLEPATSMTKTKNTQISWPSSSHKHMTDGLRKFNMVGNHEGIKIRTWSREKWCSRSSRQTFWKLWFGNARMSSPCEHMEKVFCALSSAPRLRETKMGSTARGRGLAHHLPGHFPSGRAEWETMFHRCVLCSEGLFTRTVATLGGSLEALQLWDVSNRGFMFLSQGPPIRCFHKIINLI